MSGAEQLVKMANQIALNLGANTDTATASQRVADHIHRFWTRAMREQLRDLWLQDAVDFSPVVVHMLESEGGASS